MIIAQISDPHITLPGRPFEKHFDPAGGLERAVDYLVRLPMPLDVVIVTGDMVDEGTLEEYERFHKLIEPLDTPVFVIPGNHDDRKHLRQAFGNQGTMHHDHFIQYIVDLGQVRLVALDTLIEGKAHGRLCADRLAWLDDRLSEDLITPTMIMMHHPPFAVGFPVIDEPSLEGSNELGRLVEKYGNVERVVAGHVHCHAQSRFYGTIALTCPSTTLQVHTDLNQCGKQWGVMSTPACLLHYVSESTGLVTHTCPMEELSTVRLVHDGSDWVELD